MHRPKYRLLPEVEAVSAATVSIASNIPGPPGASDGSSYVLCGLFGDTIGDRLCELRRAELNRKGVFSCEGCIVDVALTLQQEAAGIES